MRFGILLLSARFAGEDDAAALDRTVDAALTAERVGFDDVWLAEHHFMSYGVVPSALTLAGHLLGRTTRIDVGTAVSVLSTQHPVAVAEQAAMLSQVSGGRLRLGVGRGGPWRDLEVFGTGLARYEDGFPESLDLLLEWLHSDWVEARGKFFTFREVAVVPQVPEPPTVLVACTSPATETLAAERGLPMLLGMHVGDEGKAAAVARYGSPAPHVSAHLAQVASSRAEGERLLLDAMPEWLAPGLEGYVPVDDRPYSPRDATAYVRELCAHHPVGTPAEIAARIRATALRTGVRHMIFMVEGPGTRDGTLQNIERLGTEVLPLLR